MTEQERKFVNEVLKDFRIFAKKYLKIKDKFAKIVPLILNKAQEIVLSKIEDQIRRGVPIRLLVLKARQKGISTLIEAYIFWRTSLRFHRSSAVVSHEAKSTDHLYSMFLRYYDNLPEQLKPELDKRNEKGLIYGKLDSYIRCWTAGSGDVASSYTLLDLHLSEVPKWPDAKTALTSLLQTVPDHNDTMVIMEATAKGIGGEFYDRWQLAKAGESNYEPVFLSWLLDDEYTLNFKDDLDRQHLVNGVDKIEEGLLKAGATLEHLNWRRKIGLPDKCGNDIDQFRQEYPSNDVEAFIASGSPVFDIPTCYANLQSSQSFKPKIGNLEWVGSDVIFRENERGYVKIYKDIKLLDTEKYRFVAGVDTAEGLAQGDYSVCSVLDRKTDEVCLVWHGHADTDIYAKELYKISNFLKHDVFFEIESNFGSGVVKDLYKLGGKIKYGQSFEKGYPSDSTGIGFKTTSKSKKIVIDQLNEWIRDALFISKEKEFWAEALRFVRDDGGQMAAQGKRQDLTIQSFDDRIIAYSLMINCSLWLPNYVIQKPKEPCSRPFFEEENLVIDEATY